MPYILGAETWEGRGIRLTLSLPPSHCFPFSRSLGEGTSSELTFLPGLKFPSGGTQCLRGQCKPWAKALLMLYVPPGLSSTPSPSLSL